MGWLSLVKFLIAFDVTFHAFNRFGVDFLHSEVSEMFVRTKCDMKVMCINILVNVINLTPNFMCSIMILITLSTESTFGISIADTISPSFPVLRCMHLTKWPLPFCLLCFLNTAGLTVTSAEEGVSEMNVWVMDEVGMTPFSLFLLLVSDTYTFHAY